MLINGRKFDIRAYVLITPRKMVYLHKEAYVRTSGQLFNIDNLCDRYVILFIILNYAKYTDLKKISAEIEFDFRSS